MLVVVGVAVAVVGWALRHGGAWGPGGPPAQYAAARISELTGDPAALSRELTRVRDAFGVQAAVYAADGKLLATSAPEGAAPVRPEPHRRGWHVPLQGGGTLVVQSAPHDPTRGLLFIGVVLIALAAASFPLARSIAAPVERLTAAARALGAGDLSVRANVRARGELGALGSAFDEMAARLEALVRTERELLANVSHEIRTPLARIRVALELAAEGDAERARRYLGGIGQDLAGARRARRGRPRRRSPRRAGRRGAPPRRRPGGPRRRGRRGGRPLPGGARGAGPRPGGGGRGNPTAPRGRRAAPPDAREPARQRREVLGGPRANPDLPAPGGRRGGDRGAGPRNRDRAGGPPPALHAVLPDRPEPRAGYGRRGARPRPRAPDRRGAQRDRSPPRARQARGRRSGSGSRAARRPGDRTARPRTGRSGRRAWPGWRCRTRRRPRPIRRRR